MVKLIINGKNIQCPEDTTVLKAATEAGIRIPTLCNHESLQPYGSCRLCVVEVTFRGKTKIQASCALPVSDGMEVQTNTDRILNIRRTLIKLFLSRCPESNVIHELANEFGITDVKKNPFRKPDKKSPSTFVNDDGCILCGMCVRLCDDVLKIGALSFEGRGANRHVTTPFRKTSEFCVTCGACSFVCPTGAIEHIRIRPNEPEDMPDMFEYGMKTRKPINIPFPQAVPRVPVIDKTNCMNFHTGGCKVCEDNCQAEAIDHSQEDKIEELPVGAIIVATGFQLFDSSQIAQYGYGKLDNVLSAMEL